MATKNPNTVDLEYPITVDGTKIAAITLRRPTVDDMRAAKKSADFDEDMELTLFANLAGLTPDDIGKLDYSDYSALQEKLKSFLGRKKSRR